MGFTDYFSDSFKYLRTMSLADIVDVLIVAVLIYVCIGLIRRTNANRLARGIVFILLALVVSDIARLKMVNSLMRRIVELGLIAIVVIFQPEIRRLLERMGSGKFAYFFGAPGAPATMESVINQTVLACASMSESRTGALIVFERTSSLNDQIATGTVVNAEVSSELLRNIFFVNSPLHDGAVIMRDGRLAAAGCMLPLSNNASLSSDLGMRHRAGIGMSEHSDAVVAIVSEETGSISVAMDGMLKRHLTPDTFGKILRAELMPDTEAPVKRRGILGLVDSVKGLKVKKNDKEEGK
ncbi:MAG TPA: TIGR00159 family protein [Candidatus Scatomorpha merdipullorum]|uniref:Diadenylate cyclase n=1 Tax=Candidatus Scatomorpha merdipullorum TaxID=2840927 RepID=A0A9D1FES6_9FIRM|nr:TIGR00159 family protein [Candidatus Scatomorpha merdipullorum]